MRNILILSILFASAATPIVAQATTGMGAMQYYVGTWSCRGGSTSMPNLKSTATYAIESGVLREWHVIPPQGKMKNSYAFSTATSYDARNHRYVQVFLDNYGGWELSVEKPWAGSTERWTDLSTDSGKLGHGQIVRTDQNSFTITGFLTMAATTPNLKATCKRSS